MFFQLMLFGTSILAASNFSEFAPIRMAKLKFTVTKATLGYENEKCVQPLTQVCERSVEIPVYDLRGVSVVAPFDLKEGCRMKMKPTQDAEEKEVSFLLGGVISLENSSNPIFGQAPFSEFKVFRADGYIADLYDKGELRSAGYFWSDSPDTKQATLSGKLLSNLIQKDAEGKCFGDQLGIRFTFEDPNAQ